jgi:hypothetical protein
MMKLPLRALLPGLALVAVPGATAADAVRFTRLDELPERKTGTIVHEKLLETSDGPTGVRGTGHLRPARVSPW